MNTDLGNDRQLVLTKRAEYETALEWLRLIISPIDAKCHAEASVQMEVIMPAEGRNFANDTNSRLLKELFATVGFNADRVVVERDTVNFDIQYTEGSPAATPEMDGGLPLYCMADNEWGLCWTWHPSFCLVRGMIWHFTEDGLAQALGFYRKLLRLSHAHGHVLLPALLFLQNETNSMRWWVDREAGGIMACQRTTRRDSYANVSITSVDGDQVLPSTLEEMTNDVSRLAVNVMTSVLCLQRMVQLSDFILDIVHADMTKPGATYLSERTRSAKRDAEGLLLEAEAWKHKSAIVVQTLLSLTTHRQSKIGIELAESTKTLAEQTTRDSTSMKAIAAVTMCFLPGAYVSSLFAIPMFDWESDTIKHVSPQFWIYWVVTIPLTIAVIAVWRWWTESSVARAMREQHVAKSITV